MTQEVVSSWGACFRKQHAQHSTPQHSTSQGVAVETAITVAIAIATAISIGIVIAIAIAIAIAIEIYIPSYVYVYSLYNFILYFHEGIRDKDILAALLLAAFCSKLDCSAALVSLMTLQSIACQESTQYAMRQRCSAPQVQSNLHNICLHMYIHTYTYTLSNFVVYIYIHTSGTARR